VRSGETERERERKKEIVALTTSTRRFPADTECISPRGSLAPALRFLNAQPRVAISALGLMHISDNEPPWRITARSAACACIMKFRGEYRESFRSPQNPVRSPRGRPACIPSRRRIIIRHLFRAKSRHSHYCVSLGRRGGGAEGSRSGIAYGRRAEF